MNKILLRHLESFLPNFRSHSKKPFQNQDKDVKIKYYFRKQNTNLIFKYEFIQIYLLIYQNSSFYFLLFLLSKIDKMVSFKDLKEI